jgi:hypothetical protein
MALLEEEEAPTVMGENAPVPKSGSALLAASDTEETCRICLRCFVYEAGAGLYRAECIDLDIGTEANSLEGAVQGLADAINGYVLVALEGVETNEQVPAAVLRPSPLSHRLHYHWAFLVNKVASIFHANNASRKKFYRTPYGLDNADCHI